MSSLKLLKKVVLAVNLLLVLFISSLFVSFAFVKQEEPLIDPYKLVERDTPPSETAEQKAASTIGYFSPVFMAKFEYVPGSSARPVSGAVPDTPKVDITKIISLVGTVVFPDPNLSIAILEKKHEQIDIRVGDNPLKNEGIDAKIKSVSFESVTIAVYGKDEVLYIVSPEELLTEGLSEEETTTGAKPDTGRNPGHERVQRPRSSVENNNPTPAPDSRHDNPRPEQAAPLSGDVIGQFSNSYRESGEENSWVVDDKEKQWILSNPDVIANEITAVPYKLGDDGDSIEGVKITRIQQGSILEQRGLRVNDIIKEVNGKPVSSLTEARSMMNDPNTQSMSTVTIKVERLGKLVDIRYRTE